MPRLRAALLLAAVLHAAGAAAAPLLIDDDRGARVTLPAPARRIVALAPSLAEAVYAAGAGHALVGAVRFSDYPPAVRVLPRVGDSARIDAERVMALAPDLVLAWKSGNAPGDIARLESLGYAVYVAEPDRLGDIPRLLRAIGLLAGTSAAAESEARRFEQGVADLRAHYGARTAVPVFYEIWHRPLMTVNGSHLISDVLSLCGGRNVFAGLPVLTPVVSPEAVAAAHPRLILGGGSANDEGALAAQWKAEALPALDGVTVVALDPDLIQRATPRVLEGAQRICDATEAVRTARAR